MGTDSGVTITVATIYVNGTALVNPSATSNPIDFKNYVIGPGSHMTIIANTQSGFITGETYVFKIVTTRGSNFASAPIIYQGM